MSFPQYRARIRAVRALKRPLSDEDGLDLPDLDEAASEVRQVAEVLPPEGRTAYLGWGQLLTAVGQLWAWKRAIREAEVDSDRYLRAAKQRAREVIELLDEGLSVDGVNRVANGILEAQAPSAVAGITEDLLAVRLPLPFPERNRPGIPWIPNRHEEPQVDPGPVVLFLDFAINDQAVADLHSLRPNVLHDLEVRLRLSRWPDGASALELLPLSVEPQGIVEAPTYRIERANSKLEYSAKGRLLVRVAHDSLARPLEVSYDVRALKEPQDESAGPALVVTGQRHLLLRCVDQEQPWFGNEAIEEAVSEIRRQGREIGLRDEELAALLTLSGGMGLVAFDGLSSNAFPGDWTEAKFQESVRSRLRANPSIGSKLEEHPHAGGGIADLSLDRVRLELKVDPKDLSLDSAIESYGQQTAQYAVGSDRRSAVLAVLCPTKDGSAPGPLQNDIAPRLIAPPTGGSRRVLVVVVLVRRDLAKPSALSR